MTPSPTVAPSASRLARIPLPVQISLLVALLAVAGYLWTAPWRAEQFYAHANLAQLQIEAKRRPDDPRVLHFLALRLQEAGQPQEALNVALRAAERAPSDEDAYLMAAAFAGRVNGNQSAFDILSEFVRRNPHAPKVHRALARLYQKNGAHERAFAEATKAATQDPTDVDAFRIASDEALVMHDAVAAESNARRAVVLTPNDARSYRSLVAVLDRLGRSAEALAAAQKAVQVAPNDGEAHITLGSLLQRQNRHEEALGELAEARRLLPGTPNPLRETGRVQLSLQHYAEARVALEKARDAAPDDRTIAWLLTSTYKRLGDTAAAAREEARFKAIQEYQDRVSDLKLKISKGLQGEAQYRRELASLLALHGDIIGARQQYRLLILHLPDLVSARHELASLEAATRGDEVTATREARIAALLNLVDRAIAANQAERTVPPLEAAIKANPNTADLYNRLGRALGQASGVEEQAEAVLVKATQLEPKRTDLGLDAAEILASNKKIDAAEAEYRRILSLAPTNIELQAALGRFLTTERQEPEKNTEGESVLRKVLTADHANADALFGLGTLSLNRSDGKTAAEYFEAFLSKTGQRQWPDIWFALARAYQLSGNAEKAAKARAEYTRLTEDRVRGGSK